MDYEAIKREIEAIVGEGYTVRIEEVIKNNGLKLHGATILEPGNNISPTIYLENYKDMCPREIAEQVVKVFNEHRVPTFDVSALKDYEKIKDKLSVRLINGNTNKELLERLPHKELLDLAIIVVGNVELDGQMGSFKVSNGMLAEYGVSEEELFNTAWENTPKLYPVSGMNMEDALFGSAKEGLAEFSSPMYVLSNTTKANGAISIIYDGVLEKLAEQAGKDILILPSSVHEVILMPYDETIDVSYVSEMVKDVNGTELEKDEVLSNHPYLYERTAKKIRSLN